MPFLALFGIDDFIVFMVIGLVLSAGMMVLSELLRPKPDFENARPAGLGDFHFPTAVEGRVIPVIWGRVMIDGPNVVWYGDLRKQSLTQTMKTGMWSSKDVITGYEYSIGFQLALCLGQVDRIFKVWIGDDIVWNVPLGIGGAAVTVFIDDRSLFGGEDAGGAGGVEGTGVLYDGRASQMFNYYLSSYQTPNLPYRGTCHFVWEGGYLGNSTNLPPWKFEIQRCPNTLGMITGHHIIGSGDANPMCVIHEILTNTEWGFGFPTGDVDTVTFKAAAETLYTEGNGFSMTVDRVKEANDVLNEIQRQIDGILYLDHVDGKFKVKLARADYTIGLVPQITENNSVEVQDFSRGTWEETNNQIHVSYMDRAKYYKDAFASASDLANQRIQAGALISAQINYPGCKDAALAAKLANRDLRYRCTPLAKATISVDRTLWAIKPGDVIAWTDADLGFALMPMRVGKVDYGELKDGKIILSLVQDVFKYAIPFDATPPGTLWTPPVAAGLFATDPTQTFIREAPWGVSYRDSGPGGFVGSHQAGMYAVRRPTGDARWAFIQRRYKDYPTGASPTDWYYDEKFSSWMRMGKLKVAIGEGDANPTTTIQVTCDPDSQADIMSQFWPNADINSLDQNLTNLVAIGDELVLVKKCEMVGNYIQLDTVYRGVLDSVPQDHVIDTPVYILYGAVSLAPCWDSGGGLGTKQLEAKLTTGYQWGYEPSPVIMSRADQPSVYIAPILDVYYHPVPPVEMKVNTVRFPTTASVDVVKVGGTTDDDKGIYVSFNRRNYNNPAEVYKLAYDEETVSPGWAVSDQHKNDLSLYDDPDGADTLTKYVTWAYGDAIFVSRTTILHVLGFRPSKMRAEVGARHYYAGLNYESINKLGWSFLIAASEIDGWTDMGILAQNVVGAQYTAPTTGTYAFSVGPVMGAGEVQARLNGGGWGAVVTAGNRTGNLVGVTAGDIIEVRHTQAGSGETFLHVDAPTSGLDAYAILEL